MPNNKLFSGLKKVKKKKAKQAATSYRDSQAEIMKAKRSIERDIGPLPAVVNPKRKESCRDSIELFGLKYFPGRFDKSVSENHRKAIQKIEYSIRNGGLFSFAMPRGDGKTTWSETAIEWGVCYGLLKFPVIVSPDQQAAEEILKSIKMSLETNNLLLEDFPEVCFAIRELDGVANRANGQICQGDHTYIKWHASEIIFPTIKDVKTSGTIIKASGLLGRIRGMRHTLASGATIRPDFVLLDDPQTDESANSDSQCRRRETIIRSAVMGLAGPGENISAVMPCTIIRKDDLADRMLNRERNPEWRGEISRMILSWPSDMEFWENEYYAVYCDGLRSEDEGAAINKFYMKNRKRLEKGAAVAWEERKTDKEISAIQHSMNLYFKVRREAFMSEYQNDPVSPEDSLDIITVDELEHKVNGYKRSIIPIPATILTMGADVHDKVLYYLICAWTPDATGYIVEYGTYPKQTAGYFTLASASKTLPLLYPGAGKDAAIQKGVEALVDKYIGMEFKKSNGELMNLNKMLVDRGYKPEIIQSVKRSHGNQIMDLSLGVGITASKKPMAQYKKQPGEKHGFHSYYPTVRRTREFQHVKVDTNFWKTFIIDGLSVPDGDKGAITLYGSKNTNHRLIAEHLVASEFYVDTEGYGRKLREWQEKPTKPDNHWLDCLAGSACAASISGMEMPGQDEKNKPKREKVRLSELQKRR